MNIFFSIFIFVYFFHFTVFIFLKYILHVRGCRISRFHSPNTCVQCGLHLYDVRFNFHFHFFLNSASLLFHFPLLSFHLFHEPLYLCIALTIYREHFFIMSFECLQEILDNTFMGSVTKLFCSVFVCFCFCIPFLLSPSYRICTKKALNSFIFCFQDEGRFLYAPSCFNVTDWFLVHL